MRIGAPSTAMGIILTFSACTDASVASPAATNPFREVTAAEWSALGNARIFFGHQSVGRNILEGVQEVLAENGSIPVRLVSSDEPSLISGPGFFEASIGRNGDPVGKTRAFAEVLDAAGAAGALSIALHKYCYVDVQPGTDIDVLFADYVTAMEAIRTRHPETVFVHVTMPLTSAPDSPTKQLLKRILRREPDGGDLNVKRNRFNRMLLAEYGGREPIFDLARIESTREDGSRVYQTVGSDTIYSLAAEWTYDGGHLNEEGRRRVARELLYLLSTVAATGQS